MIILLILIINFLRTLCLRFGHNDVLFVKFGSIPTFFFDLVLLKVLLLWEDILRSSSIVLVLVDSVQLEFELVLRGDSLS